jgi:hypothetical protein
MRGNGLFTGSLKPYRTAAEKPTFIAESAEIGESF